MRNEKDIMYSSEKELTGKRNCISTIMRMLMGSIFILSGILKMSDLVLFEESVNMFNILSRYSKIFAIVIPSLEFVCGLFLLFGIFKKASILALLLLMFVFTCAIGINLFYGNVFDCGCFGSLNIFSRISMSKMLFNAVFIVVLIYLFYCENKSAYNILESAKIIATLMFFISMLLFIPSSNTSWAYSINVNHIESISWEKAGLLISNDNAILFDTRDRNRFDKEHVPGALAFPYMEFNNYLKLYNWLEKTRKIILYCDGKNCSLALRTGIKFIARGFKNIYKVNGGFDAWLIQN
jgi:putative oxidoreductase